MKFLMTSLMTCLLCFTALGQTNAEVLRKGFVFGTSLGIANSRLNFPSKNQNTTNLGLNWKVGYLLNPKFAVLVNGSVSIYEYDLTDRKRLRDFGGVFASAQYFATDRIWVLGGLGIGTDAPVFYDLMPDNKMETAYYSGVGIVSSIGYELFRKKNFALDVQARINYSSVNLPVGKTNGLTTALLLGINFY